VTLTQLTKTLHILEISFNFRFKNNFFKKTYNKYYQNYKIDLRINKYFFKKNLKQLDPIFISDTTKY
jgi:hypothetical protein